jgi:subtilisin family serine protease
LAVSCQTSEEDLAFNSTTAPLNTADPTARIEGQYIVVFKDSASVQGTAAAIKRVEFNSAQSRIERTYSVIPGFSAKLAPDDVEAIRRNPEVAYVEEDQRVMATTIRPAPAQLEIDRHDRCPATEDSSYNDHDCNGAGVLVYIVDTGIRSTHEQFRTASGGTRVITARGFTAISDGLGTEDGNGHGTHVASTSAGNTFGMANGASLVPVRVLDSGGSGTVAGVVAGVDFVRGNCGAAEKCVANMSLGGGVSAALDSAVTNAVNAGITFAVAAGNSNVDASGSSPARAAAALTVGCSSDATFPSTDNAANIARCTFSNFGAVVDIWASGLSVLGAGNASDTATLTISGTSMSSPHVAGAVAQLLGCTNPEPTPAQIEAILDTKALSGAMVPGGLGNAQNLFLCSDFNNDGVDDCACGGPPPPPPTNSCVQNATCGGQAPAGCWCDAACTGFGDCCPDGPC